MIFNTSQIAPKRISAILGAAEAAARAIPPAFPLDATVAVNPFLGQTEQDLATTAARLQRVAGQPVTRPGSDYAAMIRDGRITAADLAAALEASPHPSRPADLSALRVAATHCANARCGPALPTLAELATEATGIDWTSVIEKTFGRWAAGQFDRGQALWSPTPGQDAFAAWRAWAMHDLTPEIAGLKGFCAHVAAAPDTTERAILFASDALALDARSAETVFHRLFMDLGGWSQHARWLLWEAELAGNSDRTLVDLLAIRLIFEEALLDFAPDIADRWAETVAAHAVPVSPDERQITLSILQDAAERAHQRTLIAVLDGPVQPSQRPFLQAAFCIDVRSEVYRRALESVDSAIETVGFAGFFGLPLAHRAHGSDVEEKRLPVLLNPSVHTTAMGEAAQDTEHRMTARATRAWGRFKQAAVSSFAFVEAMGPLYAGKLVRDALGKNTDRSKAEPAPRIVGGLDAATKGETGAAVLRAMSMTENLGQIVLLLGHGGNVANNPHESAYHCGACGGHKGDVSARLLAMLMNDPETRSELARRRITVPDDTVFLAGLHDTTTDAVTIYADDVPNADQADLDRVYEWLEEASWIARAERAPKLPGSTWNSIKARASNWAEVRPEWGLAGCAAFIAAPREATAGKDLAGRAFLHNYDWKGDKGFSTLELIMTAPVVVASWISLQYYGSSVAPDIFGGGNKLIHNVVGGIGVIEGNSGRLRPGLPWQAVHDGEQLMHEPLRLSVMIEAPRKEIIAVLERHESVRALFDNGWLHLFALREGRVEARYRRGLEWDDTAYKAVAA